MSSRTLYLLPKKYDTMEVREALSWATDEVLRLDAENSRLQELVKHYESRERLQAREKDAQTPPDYSRSTSQG